MAGAVSAYRAHVFVNAVCAGDQCTCEMTLAVSAAQELRTVISTANAVLQHLTHVTRD